MKTFKCRDLGMDCDFVVKGETVEEVTQKAFQHAREIHADLLKTMAATPQQMAEMEKTVISKIQ